MPDLNDTTLISFEGWTLRLRTSTHPSPRFLLLIHGLTGDENSMWVFARDLPPRYWIMAPRAPYPAAQGGMNNRPLQRDAAQGGYSWRSPQFENLNQLSLDQLSSAARALIRLVDEYAASVRLDAAVFDVMGFSQGAAMSTVLAFLYPQRIRKVGILAGFAPDGLDGLVAQRPLAGKPFFVAHGRKDQMVSIDRARAALELLEQAGAQVTYCEDDVGHKLSVSCLHALKKFFAD